MSKLSQSQKILKLLKANPEQRFTAREIAEWIVKTYPSEAEDKMAKAHYINNTDDLVKQVAAEVGSRRPRLQKNNKQLKTTNSRPRQYFYTLDNDSTYETEIEETKDDDSNLGLKEHELYPLLYDYLKEQLGVYSSRIDERASKNTVKGANEWLYPDLVGIEDLSNDWDDTVKNCAKESGDKKSKLWSFEVKRRLKPSNIRKSFFQTVSNSAWANYSYLAAFEIEEDAAKELRMLSTVHGVGYIELNIENPSESQIIIPAKERDNLDWDSINRLFEASKDFKSFITNIKHYHQTGVLKDSDWPKPKA